MNGNMNKIGSVKKFWFSSADKCSGSYCISRDVARDFDVELEVTVLDLNMSDPTEVLLQFGDGTTVWAQEIDTY